MAIGRQFVPRGLICMEMNDGGNQVPSCPELGELPGRVLVGRRGTARPCDRTVDVPAQLREHHLGLLCPCITMGVGFRQR